MYKQLVGFSQETRQASKLSAVTWGMLILLIAAGSAITASAQSNSNLTFTFPIFGIIDGQSARLNIVNRTGSPGDLPPDVCDVELQFLDSMGRVRAQATIKGLAAGQAVHLDLSAGKLQDESTRRHELRAFVRVSALSGQLPPDVCRPSVEVYSESTGATKYYSCPPDPDRPALQ
jgi:hypothetical protein